MNSRKGFAIALRQLRTIKGLTQEDFSNVSSRTYLSSLERGIKSPTLAKLEDISHVLELHPATLLVLAYCRADDVKLKDLLAQITSELKLADIKT